MEYIPAKTIVSGYGENLNWFGSNYNMNIYKGCCHGCIYCDSRSDCYRVQDFDTVRAKEDAIAIIRRDLKSKRKKGVVATGSMSDPYNPFEKELELTKKALEQIDDCGFGVAIATKSSLIARDIEILKRIGSHSPVICKITITTCDDALAKKIETNVALPSERFEALRKLSQAGIFSGILLMPVLAFITDYEENISKIVAMAKANGASFIYPAFGMTLRENQRDYYYEKLDKTFPGLKQKYIQLYGDSYSCQSPKAKQLYKLFKSECEKFGILYKMKDIISAYKSGYEVSQLSFFDSI